MPRPKIPVEDRLEIQELFAYYAWGLNTGDAEQVLSCFTKTPRSAPRSTRPSAR